jgi:hypothetical protein
MKSQYLRHSLVGNVTKTLGKIASRDEDMSEIVVQTTLQTGFLMSELVSHSAS